jgi:hypothetical protein
LVLSFNEDMSVLLWNDADWVLLVNGGPNTVQGHWIMPGPAQFLLVSFDPGWSSPITLTLQYARTTTSIQNGAGEELPDFGPVNVSIMALA